MKGHYWIKGKPHSWKVITHDGNIVSDGHSSHNHAVERGMEFINHTQGKLFVENSSGKVVKICQPQREDSLGFGSYFSKDKK